MKIYLDNAATTPLDPQVFTAITPYLLSQFGNPSSLHQHGREAKNAIDQSRKQIAELLNCGDDELIFTSGGTEADNIAILSAIRNHHVKHVITTAFEHHAVLHTLEAAVQKGDIGLSYIQHDHHGNLDLKHLEELLQQHPNSLVSVMHANNEIGNLNDIALIGETCERYEALFHTDTVQTMGHYTFDLKKLKVHFLTASAHKFHGPKGVGFLYFRKGIQLTQLVQGGGQENRLRAGTENIPGIVGLAKALTIAYHDLHAHHTHVQGLKNSLISQLASQLEEVRFNGNSANSSLSLYTVLSVSLPSPVFGQSLLRCLDQLNISVSGGSACSAGATSHVLKALNIATDWDTVRFSFSRFNTQQEIDHTVKVLESLYQAIPA